MISESDPKYRPTPYTSPKKFRSLPKISYQTDYLDYNQIKKYDSEANMYGKQLKNVKANTNCDI